MTVSWEWGAPHTSHDDVVGAATDLRCHEGPDAVWVRNVAGRLGVSYQVVYSRFGGKSGLVDAMVRRGHALLTGRLDAVSEPVGSPQRVVALGPGLPCGRAGQAGAVPGDVRPAHGRVPALAGRPRRGSRVVAAAARGDRGLLAGRHPAPHQHGRRPGHPGVRVLVDRARPSLADPGRSPPPTGAESVLTATATAPLSPHLPRRTT